MTDTESLRVGSIERVDQAKALTNSTRLRILQVASGPTSARHIATRLGVPITRLYYHLDQLCDAGFLEVADVRKSGAQLERLYRRTAERFEPSPDLVDRLRGDPAGLGLLAAVIAEPARVEVESVLAAGPGDTSDVTRTVVRMSEADAAEYVRRTKELILEFVDRGSWPDAAGRHYALTHVFAPLEPPAGEPAGQ